MSVRERYGGRKGRGTDGFSRRSPHMGTERTKRGNSPGDWREDWGKNKLPWVEEGGGETEEGEKKSSEFFGGKGE